MNSRSSRCTGVILAITLVLAAPVIAACSPGVNGSPSASPAAAPIRLTLPQPTGRYPIGSSSLHLVDQARADPWWTDRKRELMVTLTYPASRVESSPAAEWLSPRMAAVVGNHLVADPVNIPQGSVAWADTKRWAHTDVPVDRDHNPWPVVLFSPASDVPREQYTVLTDDLASRGFVVVAMSHTYETLGVEFPGGRVESAVKGERDLRPETMKIAIDARVADARFVLDALSSLNAGGNPDVEQRQLPPGLRGALDMSRIGMFGHSYGGYTAGEAMYHDRRITAGVNLDGAMAYGLGLPGLPYLPGEVTKHGLDRPFLLMGVSGVPDPTSGKKPAHNHLPGSLDQSWVEFWNNQQGWKRDLTLSQGRHMSYSDFEAVVPQLGLLYPPVKSASLIGTGDPARTLNAQHDYLAAFFDLYLCGRDNHLLDGPSLGYPEIHFAG